MNAFFLEANCFDIYRYHHFHYTLVAQKNTGYNLKESIIDLPVLLTDISLKPVVLRLLELISETAFPDKWWKRKELSGEIANVTEINNICRG